MTDNKKFNLKLAAMWGYRDGSLFMSMPVDDQVFDALQGVEKGGKLVLKVLSDESRKTEKSPHAYLEYISKEDVEAFEARKGGKGGARRNKTSRVAEENDGI